MQSYDIAKMPSSVKLKEQGIREENCNVKNYGNKETHQIQERWKMKKDRKHNCQKHPDDRYQNDTILVNKSYEDATQT